MKCLGYISDRLIVLNSTWAGRGGGGGGKRRLVNGDGSVGTVAGLRVTDDTVSIFGRERICLFTGQSRPLLGATKPRTHWAPAAWYPMLKRS